MHFKGWRLHFILFAALLSLSLLTGGQWAYRYYGQEKPLVNTLKADPAIQEVKLVPGATSLEIQVSLGPIANLQQTYRQMAKVVRDRYGQQQVKLVIQDNSSPALDKLWQDSQYAVYEAAVRGNFTQMATTVAGLAARAGVVDYSLSIDAQNIYLQFSQGQNYLYRVIPRQNYGQRG